MNVLILTEGGRDIGFGHITRCTSIYQAFEEKGFSPELIVNGDQTVERLVQEKRCRMMDWLTVRAPLCEMISTTDVVFVDSYLADCDLYEEISNRAGTAVYFDDTLRMEYPKGFVLNGAICAEQMPYPKRNGVTYLLGARYAPLRKEFWEVPVKVIRDDPDVIMVTFGGTDVHNLTPKVLKLLARICPTLLKKVVIAEGFQNVAEIERLKDDQIELIHYPNAARMKKAMLESDVAISAGGQTLFELARVGVPTIVVTVADNQSGNVRGWEKLGFAEDAGRWDNETAVDKISQSIQRLMSKNLRQERYTLGREAVDGAGSRRVVKKVLSAFCGQRLTFRRATLADARDIFDLANDAAVRKGSFESDPIEWGDHLGWLRAKLGNNHCCFFVVDCQGDFAGQVRFDIVPERREAEISVSLRKHLRGLGLSPRIVSRSIGQLLKACKEVNIVKAYIKRNNTASIRCFEEAGFTLLKNARIKGHESSVYERTIGHDPK